jgi:hypothetical protein
VNVPAHSTVAVQGHVPHERLGVPTVCSVGADAGHGMSPVVAMQVSNDGGRPGPHATDGQVVALGWQMRSWVAAIPEESALGEGPMHWLDGTDTLTEPMPQEGPTRVPLTSLQLALGALTGVAWSWHELP